MAIEVNEDDEKTKKNICYVGSAEKDINKFPTDVADDISGAIDMIAYGEQPDNFKPMKSVGDGVYEIREKDGDTWYRVFYVAKLGDTVYVLHAFRKNQTKTPKKDLETGQKRYKRAVEIASDK